VVGCSSSEAGVPVPADTGSSAPVASLDGVAPCDLLTAEDVADIGLEDGDERSDVSCDWKKTSTAGVRLTLYPDRGFDTAPDQGTSVEVGTYAAHRVASPGGQEGSCGVSLEISASSFVGVVADDGTDTDAACELATDAARRIDANLS
jgi:Protein of unknown function (DUF3558)